MSRALLSVAMDNLGGSRQPRRPSYHGRHCDRHSPILEIKFLQKIFSREVVHLWLNIMKVIRTQYELRNGLFFKIYTFVYI